MLEKLAHDQHSSLLQKFVDFVKKYWQEPEHNVKKSISVFNLGNFTNIQLSLKSLLVTNTLAYYKNLQIVSKRFKTLSAAKAQCYKNFYCLLSNPQFHIILHLKNLPMTNTLAYCKNL